MPTKQKATPVREIRFKFARNIMIYDLAKFMSDEPPMPPHTSHVSETVMVLDQTVPLGRREERYRYSTFDLDFEHAIRLEDTHPREVLKTVGMSDAWMSRLQDREMNRACDAASRMDDLRRILTRLSTPIVPGGLASISITSDPTSFMSESPFLSDADAADLKREQSEARALELLAIAGAKR